SAGSSAEAPVGLTGLAACLAGAGGGGLRAHPARAPTSIAAATRPAVEALRPSPATAAPPLVLRFVEHGSSRSVPEPRIRRWRTMPRGLWLLVVAGAALSGCDRESRPLTSQPETAPAVVAINTFSPGPPAAAPSRDPRAAVYEGSAFHISQGQQYFRWFNCNG